MASVNLISIEQIFPNPAVLSKMKVLLESFSLQKLGFALRFAMGEILGHLPGPSSAAFASSQGCER